MKSPQNSFGPKLRKTSEFKYAALIHSIAKKIGDGLDHRINRFRVLQILCAAFESGVTGDGGRLEDLVHAAWGVFESRQDEDDAVDSLVRIVRLAVTPFKQ